MIDLLLGVEMADADAHRKELAKLCIFCGSTVSKKTERPKNKFKMTLNDILVLILKSAVEGLS